MTSYKSELFNDIEMSEVLLKAIEISRAGYDFKNDLNKISVTSLINPPKYIELHRRHHGEYQTPVSKCVRAFVGTAVHEAVEKVKLDGLISEKRLEASFEDFIVSGKFDILLLTDSYGLEDMKVTSFWSIVYDSKGKKEWIEQMNIYKFLVEENYDPIKVKSLKVNAILYDWSPNIQKYFPPAPDVPEKTVDIEIWPPAKLESFLRKRIALYKEAQALPDDEIPICTDKERWHQPKKYLAIKEGNKNPTKSFYSYSQLKMFLAASIKQNIKYNVEIKEAIDYRCTQYCFAKQFCNYWRKQYGDDKCKKN